MFLTTERMKPIEKKRDHKAIYHLWPLCSMVGPHPPNKLPFKGAKLSQHSHPHQHLGSALDVTSLVTWPKLALIPDFLPRPARPMLSGDIRK